MWKTKSLENKNSKKFFLGKLFEDDRNGEQNKSPKFLFSLIFPNPKIQNQIGSLKPKNTFENLEINYGEALIFLAKKNLIKIPKE